MDNVNGPRDVNGCSCKGGDLKVTALYTTTSSYFKIQSIVLFNVCAGMGLVIWVQSNPSCIISPGSQKSFNYVQEECWNIYRVMRRRENENNQTQTYTCKKT